MTFSDKKLKWWHKLGLYTLEDITFYKELRKFCRVREALRMMDRVKGDCTLCEDY